MYIYIYIYIYIFTSRTSTRTRNAYTRYIFLFFFTFLFAFRSCRNDIADDVSLSLFIFSRAYNRVIDGGSVEKHRYSVKLEQGETRVKVVETFRSVSFGCQKDDGSLVVFRY